MMIKLKEIGSSVSILNTGTTVVRAKNGLSVIDRCGTLPFKQPIVLDNGVELSSIEGELVIRHPYGLPVYVACMGEFLMQCFELKITPFNIMWRPGEHTSMRGRNVLQIGDTFDVQLNGSALALCEQTADGVKVQSRTGVHLELR